VFESACKSKAKDVLIATDDQRIFEVAQAFGANVVMTSSTHTSGTDRLAEAITILEEPDDTIIVNLQGDEIGMPATLIDQVAKIIITRQNSKMATLCELIDDRDNISNPNVVKVVFDNNDRAIYFSRAVIPWGAKPDNCKYYRHIGLYAFRSGFLKQFSNMPRCELEESESLEQLRVLYNGEEIYIDVARDKAGIGVDTEDDLERARQYLLGNN
jgi:3-deoxy-manno-octulosonate cytidylyltransferase (CMP-KDO synthetase)